ncbi:transcription factor IBH1-like isoform X2 [Camellia sinensis]|uniref:transcription factor IBH1-like isoform X2 n=1 Tax=Camellia sinensis TaxID=4442 RepID=UPI0010367830|nr:transcription factor IBH1-like isoform X2 [Camellia sinensis]
MTPHHVSMKPHQISMKPSSIKTRFAYGFMRTLKRLSKRKPTSSSSPREIFRSYRMIKMASDASMASAVGCRRAWSHAMLWKIRCQLPRRCHALGRRKRSRTDGCRRRGVANKAEKELGLGQTDELRDLVPGGETMDLNILLGETAHYIKCLTTQSGVPGEDRRCYEGDDTYIYIYFII